MKKILRRHMWTIITGISVILFCILRIPSLFEPHWYGDEGVYAAVAYALESGRTLYTTVWDNKPPLIYFIYMIGNHGNRLLVIRLINIIAGILSIAGLSAVSHRFKFSKKALIAVMLVSTLCLGLPTFEGNIANGENLFLPFIIWGFYFGTGQRLFELGISGILYGLAFSIKFNPLLDVLALVYVILLSLISHRKFREAATKIGSFILGFAIPMLWIALYLNYHNAFNEGIQTIFFENIHYSHVFENPFLPQYARIFLLGTSLVFIGFLFIKKRISLKVTFLTALFATEYFAVLLSGRTYSHYLLQLIPAIALLTGYVCMSKKSVFKLCGFFIFVLLCGYIFYHGNMDLPITRPIPYYSRFITYITHNESYFLHTDDLRFTRVKHLTNLYYHDLKIHIYSDNPWIYDILRIPPPLSFVTAYHQTVRPNGEALYLQELKKLDPDVIIFDENAYTTNSVLEYILLNYQLDRNSDGYLFFVKRSGKVA